MTSTASRFWSLPERRPWLALALAILAVEVVGASGAIFTASGLASWYPSLVQPDLAPPNWVFGPVWTTLFALMGVATWLVWRRAGDESERVRRGARFAVGVFAAHMVVNVAWSGVYFGLQSLFWGLVVIAVLWLVIVASMAAYWRVDRRAALLLIPYLVWVSFASYLNYAFWALN